MVTFPREPRRRLLFLAFAIGSVAAWPLKKAKPEEAAARNSANMSRRLRSEISKRQRRRQAPCTQRHPA